MYTDKAIRFLSVSIPINKCFKSYPVLSLRRVPSMSSTVPFAKTASRPEKLAKIMGKKWSLNYLPLKVLYKELTAGSRALKTPLNQLGILLHISDINNS